MTDVIKFSLVGTRNMESFVSEINGVPVKIYAQNNQKIKFDKMKD